MQLWKTYVYNKYIPRHGAFKLIQMAKTRKLTATFADGLILKRTTARTYTHVVIGQDKWGNHYEKWCGRPDLVAKQTAKLTTYKVGEVTNDPWAN